MSHHRWHGGGCSAEIGSRKFLPHDGDASVARVYAYVEGKPLNGIDPLGLDESQASGGTPGDPRAPGPSSPAPYEPGGSNPCPDGSPSPPASGQPIIPASASGPPANDNPAPNPDPYGACDLAMAWCKAYARNQPNPVDWGGQCVNAYDSCTWAVQKNIVPGPRGFTVVFPGGGIVSFPPGGGPPFYVPAPR